jgi:hypothetical protein
MPQAIPALDLAPEPFDPGRQRLRRRLQPVEHPPPGFPQVSTSQRIHERSQNAGLASRLANTVYGGSRQPVRRSNHDQVQVSQTGYRLYAFPSAAADSRTAREKQGNVTAQLGRQLGQPGSRPSQLPTFVGQHERGSGVAGPSSQACGCGNPLHQLQTRPTVDPRATAEQFHRPKDKVLASLRYLPRYGTSRSPRRSHTLAAQTDLPARLLSETQRVVQVNGDDERFDLVIPVLTLPEHLEEQIQLCRRVNNETRG